jgi:LAGLIDADG DNA endonuclease family
MGDGNFLKDRNIIRIYTNSFSRENVELLSNIINGNLNINNKVIHDRNNQYIILIEGDNVKLTQKLILPYMHPSIFYKLGIEINEINKFNYMHIIEDI